MKNKDKLGMKLLFYFGGLLVMALGVIISSKANLGVPPSSSIAYTMDVCFGIPIGVATVPFFAVLVLLQILLLRKNYKLINLLQLPVGIVFGIFLTSFQKLFTGIPTPDNFLLKLVMLLISTVFVAAGLFLYISPGFITLAPDGFILAVATVTKKKYHDVKIVFDVSMVTVSMITCLLVIHSLGSVGIGTVISAVIIGYEIKLMTKFFGKQRDELLGLDAK